MHSKTYLHTISEMLQRSKKFTLPPPIKENDVKPKEQKSRKFSVFKGLFLAMISGIFYSIAAVVVKKMNNMHTGQLAVYRFIAILVFSMPSAVKSRENLFGPKDLRFLLILRGIFGATNLFLNFMAFRYLPLGEAAVIIFSVPVFVTVAARIFLKEPCGIFQSVTVLLTVIGILLTTKIPLKLASISLPYTSDSLYGIIAAIVSLLFSTLRFIVIRKVKRVHHSIIMFNNGWVALLESLILTAIVGNFKWHDCGYEGLFIIVLGLVSYIGQTLLTVSLQCEMAGPVSTMRAAADIVLAFVWQIILFHDIPDALSLTGAVLVGFSVIFVGLKKWATSLPPESTQLRYVGWMTR